MTKPFQIDGIPVSDVSSEQLQAYAEALNAECERRGAITKGNAVKVLARKLKDLQDKTGRQMSMEVSVSFTVKADIEYICGSMEAELQDCEVSITGSTITNREHKRWLKDHLEEFFDNNEDCWDTRPYERYGDNAAKLFQECNKMGVNWTDVEEMAEELCREEDG